MDLKKTKRFLIYVLFTATLFLQSGCGPVNSQVGQYVTVYSLAGEYYDKNKSAVSFSSLEKLIELDIGEIRVGDLVSVDAFALLNKGSLEGDTLVLLRSIDGEGPTGQILFAMDTIDLEDRRFSSANGRIQTWLSGTGYARWSGRVRLGLFSASAGSESSSDRSQIQIRVRVFRPKLVRAED